MFSEETEKKISLEFPSLRDTCYLDHAGTTLYANEQLQAVFKELKETVFGNPHSLSLSSRHTTDIIDQVRFRILNHFHTSPNEYSVIFTSGTSAALKLLAESFKWHEEDGVSDLTPKNLHNSDSSVHRFPKCQNDIDCSSRGMESCNCPLKPFVVENQESYGNGSFVHLQDNHTSVLGMRELAAKSGASVYCIPHDSSFSILEKKKSECKESGNFPLRNSLFVYPAQSNFSGVKYPLTWVNEIHSGVLKCCNSFCCHYSNWFCCLDAASFVSTSDLNLSLVKPDFVCVSFYKIFGYPTGIGALLVRNTSSHTLKKNYFAGGTVQISLSSQRFHVFRSSLSEQFEDGTIPFLSIVALRHGFDILQSLAGSMEEISLHTFSLAKYVHHNLLVMHHANGSPVAVLYCDTDYEDISSQGNIVNFNLLRSNGEFIGFAEVLNFANLYNIHLRTGCFCNPGACQHHLKQSVKDLKHNFQAGHVCGDEMDLIEGKPTGSVRISFGYMSTKYDADKLLNMITSCFVDGPIVKKTPLWWPNFQRSCQQKFCMDKNIGSVISNSSKCENGEQAKLSGERIGRQTPENERRPSRDENLCELLAHLSFTKVVERRLQNWTSESSSKNCSLTHIFVYPVKSCGAMSASHWEVNSRGLVYDREWMIVGPSGVALTQKSEAKLCLIRPTIDLENGCIVLEYAGLSPITIPLMYDSKLQSKGSLCESKVCGDFIEGWDCGNEVAQWLCAALNRDGLRLLRQGCENSRTSKFKLKKERIGNTNELSLANKAQFLLVNISSIHWLAQELPHRNLSEENLLQRFRSNLVVNASTAFEESQWSSMKIGDTVFEVEGPCTRCQMVCIDQQSGERTKEPLRTLAEALHGKMRFGIYLKHHPHTGVLRVGDEVTILS